MCYFLVRSITNSRIINEVIIVIVLLIGGLIKSLSMGLIVQAFMSFPLLEQFRFVFMSLEPAIVFAPVKVFVYVQATFSSSP